MAVEISVVIPALNEQKYIKYSLSGLKRQTFKNFETIVVDGGSEDGTAALARKYAKVIMYTKRGAASGRNRGAKIAKGRIILFLDADTKPTPRLLETYSKIFSDKDVAVATGPIYPLERTRATVRLGYSFVSKSFTRLSILIGLPAIAGSNFAVRADAFRKAGGFNEKFITYEDWDLSGRIKKYGKIVYSKDAVVYTSARRVLAWGVIGYFLFYAINILMYYFLRRARTNYTDIR